MIPNPTQCCFYEIEEGTKNERIAVGSNGNVLRWSASGGPEQQWLVVPVSNTKVRIVTVSNGEYMAVGSNGNIVRWALAGDEQTFEFVNPSPDGWWNIRESTRNEFVAVGSDGNVLRWGWSGGKEQKFRLVPVTGPSAPTLKAGTHKSGQIPDIPRVTNMDVAPPEQSPEYLIGQVSVPATLVDDSLYSSRSIQVSTNPYYVMSRYQLWDRSLGRGWYYDHDGHTSVTEKETITVGISKGESVAVEETLGLRMTAKNEMSFKLSGGGKVDGVVDVGGELSGTSSIEQEISKGLQITTTRSTDETYEHTKEIAVTLESGGRVVRVGWSLVDRYVLTRADGSEVMAWEVVVPQTRREDSLPPKAK